MPFLASACAYGWAWLFYPRAEPKEYGPFRGVVVTFLACLSFSMILSSLGFSEGAGLFVIGLLLMPFSLIVFVAGAGAGAVNLRWARSKMDRLIAIVCRR